MTAEEADEVKQMEAVVMAYVSGSMTSRTSLGPIRSNTPLIDSGIVDSLSLLKLVLFLEQRFGISVDLKDLTRDNFGTIDAICSYLLARRRRADGAGISAKEEIG